MKKYIHIGYPKNLSTTLQINFFSNHSNILHLGIGHGGENLKYFSKEFAVYFEALLKAREIEFKKISSALKDCIYESIHETLKESQMLYGVSHESLAYHFSNDEVDIHQKIDRLRQFFGEATKIIVIIREQVDLIRSLYKESLKAGMSLDYADYVTMLHRNRFQGFFNELQYDQVLALYEEAFGIDNMLILPLEKYRENGLLLEKDGNTMIIADICNFLQIPYQKCNLSQNNPSLNDGEAFQLMCLNKEHRYNLGKGNHQLVDIHKYKNVFDYYGYEEPQLYGDVKVKRLLIELASALAKKDHRTLSYALNASISKEFSETFIAANERVAKKFNLELPSSYFSITF